MIGRTTKQKISIMLFIIVIVGVIGFGIVNYTYSSLESVDGTDSVELEDKNVFEKYFDSFYYKLQKY